MKRSLLAALLLVFVVPTAHAQTPVDQELANIREQIFQARFDDAVRFAGALLLREDLDATQRNATLEVMATAQIANRDRPGAQRTLRTLYQRDPGHRLTDPDASPPVIAAFARARERAPDPIAVSVEHRAPVLSRRESPEIVARVTQGADAVAELRLVYASGGDQGRVVMSRRADGSFAGRIPVVGAASEPSVVSYHLVALAPSQTPLGQLGSESESLQLTIPAGAVSSTPDGERPPDLVNERPPALGGDGSTEPVEGGDGGGGSVAEEAWFWILIAVLVVGGGVTAGVLLGTQSGGPEEGTLGVGQLELLRF